MPETLAIKPVRTEADYERALKEIESLMDARAGTPEGDELDVLATLVDAYEAEHYPIEAPDPIALIEFAMEQRGADRADLEPMIGTRARVSEILTRKRALSLAMIRRLSDEWHLPSDALIRAYSLRKSAAGKSRRSRTGRKAAA